jgi:hypothetical protein
VNNINSTLFNITINKATGLVYLYVNGSRSDITIGNEEAGRNIWLNGSLQTGIGNVEIYRNGTLEANTTSPAEVLVNLTSGDYNITAKYLGNENYTADSEAWIVSIHLPVVYYSTNAPALELKKIVLNYPREVEYNKEFIINISLYGDNNKLFNGKVYINKPNPANQYFKTEAGEIVQVSEGVYYQSFLITNLTDELMPYDLEFEYFNGEIKSKALVSLSPFPTNLLGKVLGFTKTRYFVPAVMVIIVLAVIVPKKKKVSYVVGKQ